MKRSAALYAMAGLSVFLTGCLTPVDKETPLASGDLSLRVKDEGEIKLIIFNDSNSFWYGIDGTGRMNVTLDGRGVAQLKIGQYAQLFVSKGHHEIELVHRDIRHFGSHHSVQLNAPETFLRIRATLNANKVELVSVLPQDFEKRFKPVH